MKCKNCGSMESKVLDSRQSEEGLSIRRRRECINCGERFTTYETIESTPVYVVKTDGSRQVFDINKVRVGIMKACEKCKIPISKIDELIKDIEKKVANECNGHEIQSRQIGEFVMEGLRKTDGVAYIRYASVYKQFQDVESFVKEVNMRDKEE